MYISKNRIFLQGKTFMLEDLIRRMEIFLPNARGTKVLYCYGSQQPRLGGKNYVTFQGLPDIDNVLDLASRHEHVLLCLDDVLEGKK